MESPLNFIDDEILEKEVMHDLKFPRILVNSEILSITMVKRIIDLLAGGRTYQHVADSFSKEFLREIDDCTVEAIVKQDFTTTDSPIPYGEHIVWAESPAINHPEFVRGNVIPSGIYYHIIDMRQEHPSYVVDVCMDHWGFTIDEDTVNALIEEWFDKLPTNEENVPIEPTGDPRPVHPGRRASQLETEISEAADQRELFDIPPPLYEPRPTWGGRTFRHPREIGGSEINGRVDLDILPHAESPQDEAKPPEYSAGPLPPSYESAAGLAGSSTQDFTPVPRRRRRRPAGPSLPYQPPLASEQKHPNWPCCPSVLPFRFTKDDIVEYLFCEFPEGTLIYGYGPEEEPEQVTTPPSRFGETGIRGTLLAAALARKNTLNESNTLIYKGLDQKNPTSWEELDTSLGSTVVLLFEILQKNLALGTEKIQYQHELSASKNARELVNHLRLHRGFDRVHFWEEDTTFLMSSVLELLQWANDRATMLVLRTFAEDEEWKFSDLPDFLLRVVRRQQMLGGNLSVGEQAFLDTLTGTATAAPFMGFGGANNGQANDDIDMQDATRTTSARRSSEVEEDEDSQPIFAFQESRRLRSAEPRAELNNVSMQSARVARHQRIFDRLSDWLTLLTDLPENRDAGDEIADKLMEYEAEIHDLEEYEEYQPRLWSLGHEIEELLTDLEVDTFIRMYSVGADGVLQWESRFIHWLANWIESLRQDITEVAAEYYLLTHGPLRMVHLPSRYLEVRPVLRHRHLVQDLRYAIDSWDGLRQRPIWSGIRDHIEAIQAFLNVGPRPVASILMDIRLRFKNALLTLDSCLIVRESADPHLSNDARSSTPEDAIELDNNSLRPSGFDWDQVASVAPVPQENSDQPPSRPIGMGADRRNAFHLAMQHAFECRHIVMHNTPIFNSRDLDLWDDAIANDDNDDGNDDDDEASGGSSETHISASQTDAFSFTFHAPLPTSQPEELPDLPDYESSDEGEIHEDDDGDVPMDLGTPISPVAPPWEQQLP